MRNPESKRIDLAEIRRRLEESKGERFWRSLEEVAGTPEFLDYLRHEFPEQADTWLDRVSRRSFLRLMGASLALGGLAACRPQPAEHIVPYVRSPEEFVPGKPLFYATAAPFRGYGRGVLAESNMGRPTRIEGNGLHPSSLGATDMWGESSILTLWDPDRSQVVKMDGTTRSWDDFITEGGSAWERLRTRRGNGLRILTRPFSSPTLSEQMRIILRSFPAARWHQWDPASLDRVRAGTIAAFGQPLEVRYHFDRAKVVIAFDSDFLLGEPGSIRYAHDFASGRRIENEKAPKMSRLYAAEPEPSITGSMADHRIRVGAAAIETVIRALAGRLSLGPVIAVDERTDRWLDAAASDLLHHRDEGLVVAGEHQPPIVHAIVHAINQSLGNNGRTVTFSEPVLNDPVDTLESLRQLTADMAAGKVTELLIIGGNPAYDAPSDFEFARYLREVPRTTHLSLYENETSARCRWHIPEAHFLESWSDIRGHDGTVSIMQPLIAPLYAGKSAIQLLRALIGDPLASDHDVVRELWKREQPDSEPFDRFWRTSLHDGIIHGSALPQKVVAATIALPLPASGTAKEPATLEVLFRPDPTIRDGQHANNGWLQELPKPVTKLTWDNAVLVSPELAAVLGVETEDLVRLTNRGHVVEGAIFIDPGRARDTVTLHLGYGRRRAGRVGVGRGFDAYPLRFSEALQFDHGLKIEKLGQRYPLATTQHHQAMESRDLVRVASLDEFRKNPEFARRPEKEPGPGETLNPGYQYNGYRWGMSIDLNSCIGCMACVISCQSENNIPVVGKEQVLRSREMHWIRIDRYYSGTAEEPQIHHQPVPCMHCEQAPCEYVCPVGATIHSPEGLNEMIYNRCVGTRYCSNNCPYKVRRFNFIQYSNETDPTIALMKNPNVTVRSRGVMEKCSYCVQRIQTARIDAEKGNRRIRDGDVVTACQAACPTKAIVFGDTNDRNAEVSKKKLDARNYPLLPELNTRPRTTYLAKLKNPNPSLEDS